ncbi:Lipopolysaccharide export system protein LptC [BD1-7 clade bacterium]|uniref:Lipopolysaccharide export system protein LptC n=1 Tax=BD1-7 clade bacterium TaxID=2029982 RepID=A0A5S9MX68_9GAMM|nr:Lipopolysaccharide export system protein LptC [BD1-7 clade bacterium]
MNRLGIGIGFLLLVVASLIWYDGSFKGVTEPRETNVSDTVDSYFVNVKSHDFDETGELAVSLKSDHAQRFLGSTVIQLDQPHLKYFAQKIPWYGRSDAGQYDTDKETVTMQDNVVLYRADDQARLTTQILTYKKQQGLIETPDRVTITFPEGDTKGRGMTIHLDTELIELHNDVESYYDPAKAPQKNKP